MQMRISTIPATMSHQIVRFFQHTENESSRLCFLGRVIGHQAAVGADMLTKKFTMLSMCVTILEHGRDISPTDKITSHCKVWPVGRVGALLLE